MKPKPDWTIRVFTTIVVLTLVGAFVNRCRAQENVLVLIADDMGVDQVGVYAEGSDLPPTPVIDALAGAGVMFRNAYANPICSPTRATWQTGRYAKRTRIGTIVVDFAGSGLNPDAVTIAEKLDGYATAWFGKWHLSGPNDPGGPAIGPNAQGWDHFDGSLYNLADYFSWTRTVDGTQAVETQYATTANVDAALAWIGSAPEPWLAVVAFNAPHKPFHEPPRALHSQEITDDRSRYRASVEALDGETGRLLAGMRTAVAVRTSVVFFGDNGTVADAVVAPFDPDKAKPTVYEGGLNVPLIVASLDVAAPGRESAALVGSVDVYATILELAGVENDRPDSVSLVPYLADPRAPEQRGWAYGETFTPNNAALPSAFTTWERGIRDATYKLVCLDTLFGDTVELYDLEVDPFEDDDLLADGVSAAEQLIVDELMGLLP